MSVPLECPRYCAVGRLGAARPAFRSFQFRIALKPRKNVPCVCQRQNGRIANITTWPLPIGASTTCARPASDLAADERARQQHVVGVRRERTITTRGRLVGSIAAAETAATAATTAAAAGRRRRHRPGRARRGQRPASVDDAGFSGSHVDSRC